LCLGLLSIRLWRELAAELGEAFEYEPKGGLVVAGSDAPGLDWAFAQCPDFGREVFEHVPDPNDFLAGVRASLTDDGVGLVEVPSLEQALEHHRFYDFFPDHVNYWSVATLGRALERNGFLVLEVTRGMNGEYLQASVRVDAGRDLRALAASVATVRDALRAAGMKHAGAAVGIYGKRVAEDTVLASGDRVEVYRPLLLDPKERRRERARSRRR
jgi:putative ubiquitin-RnfH superfamily antitoxin RatB of RatAB toxin-antitoxin module